MNPIVLQSLITGAVDIFTKKEAFKENLTKPSSIGGYGLIALGVNYIETDRYVGLGLVVCGVMCVIFRKGGDCEQKSG